MRTTTQAVMSDVFKMAVSKLLSDESYLPEQKRYLIGQFHAAAESVGLDWDATVRRLGSFGRQQVAQLEADAVLGDGDVGRLAEEIMMTVLKFRDAEGRYVMLHIKPATADEFAARILAEREEAAIEMAQEAEEAIP